MDYAHKTQDSNEEILAEFTYHWIYTAIAIAWLLVLGPVFGLGVVIFVYMMLRKRTTHIVVTSKRFVFQSGLISNKTVEFGLERIAGCRVDQNVLARMLGYGSVVVNAFVLGEVHLIRYLKDPIKFRQTLMAARAGVPMPAPAAMPVDLPEEAPA